jgi:hypothetical protein
MRRSSWSVLVLLFVMLTAAMPAIASPKVFLIHYADHVEFEAGNDDCTSFPMFFTYDIWGTFHAVPHGDSVYFGANNFNETATYTNLSNGKTFTWISHGVDKDLHATIDDEGILTIEAQEAGPVLYFDLNGRLVFREAGLFKFVVVIDIGDPEDPDDDVTLDKTGISYHGIDQIAGRDFCDVLNEYIG